MIVAQKYIDMPDDITKLAVNNYLTNPSDQNYYKLIECCNQRICVSGLIYQLIDVNSAKANNLRHLIAALFTDGRYLEALYFIDNYYKKFHKNKEIARLWAMSCIESGLIPAEHVLFADMIALGEDDHHIKTFRIAYNLRIGRTNEAHATAVELVFDETCMEHGYCAIVDVAVRTNDASLLAHALCLANAKKIRLSFGKMKENKITKMLRHHVTNTLWKLKNG